MANDKKIHSHISSGGMGLLDENGVALVENMINENGANVKRHGHKNILTITDKNMNPLRINGIFDYSCKENGETVFKKIIHAGNKLFKASADFKNPQEIELPSDIILKDEKTRAFSRENKLWIVGACDILIYDGEAVKSAYEHENTYIPETTLTGDGEDSRVESPNILTTKRINTFSGTTAFRDLGVTNVFLLDENVKYGTEFLLEIKIRTRTSEESANSTTSQYIGVDSLGSEVSTIVTLRYSRKNLTEGGHYFLNEPIRDEAGNIINLKIDDKVFTYDKLPFGLNVKNGTEVRLAFDLPAPIKGKNNIFVKYIAEENGEKELIKKAELVATASGEKGGEIMLLNFGDNKIYFTDEKRGFFYLPRSNKISLGSDGEKITGIARLSDSLVGVFKKNSFYRIKFVSSNSDGYEIISSTDLVGAYSGFSTSLVDYECLTFNKEGVYGVGDKSSSNTFSCLRPRSLRINSYLSKYSIGERENAQSISYKSRYYLFIGNDVYVADTRRKYKEKGRESDAYEYEWWIWRNCSARVLYSDGHDLYFGKENGQIRRFYEGFSDIDEREFSNMSLSLILNNDGSYTEFIIPKIDELDFYNTRAHLGQHKRLASRGAIYENGVLYIEKSNMFFPDGSVRFYDGDTLAIYDREGNFILKTKSKEIDLIFRSIELESHEGLDDGCLYDVYFCLDNGFDYEITTGSTGAILLWNKEKIKVIDENIKLTTIEITPIECTYKTLPIGFDTINFKTLYNMFLKLTNETRGEIVITLETEKSLLKKKAFIGEPISFDEFDTNSITFSAPFKSTQLVQSYLRNFENLSIEIKSKSTKNFGLEKISLLYLKSPKPKRI